ncbi:MAG: hypothetical protein RRB13_01735 [bacterium]|nr:hypothetical protein [bacterium]
MELQWLLDHLQEVALGALVLVVLLLVLLLALKLRETLALARRRRLLTDQLSQAYDRHRHQPESTRNDR